MVLRVLLAVLPLVRRALPVPLRLVLRRVVRPVLAPVHRLPVVVAVPCR